MAPITTMIADARKARLDDKVDSFLATRFGGNMVEKLKTIHVIEEQRPIENLWDVTVAATALARDIPYIDQRVALERTAGQVMSQAANFKPLKALELD